ncbi:MAG: DALR domain-containing protein, partial [Candidatus Cybelea sp.]
IAQSEPLMSQPPMANFWVHGGLLLFDNRKMAKSLGNFEPLSDMLLRHDPQAIRWLFLQTGYRKVMNFTEDSIAAAGLGLSKIKTAYRFAAAQRDVGSSAQPSPFDARMEAALDDDMNTAAALAVLYEFAANAPFGRLHYWLTILGIEPNESWLEEPVAELRGQFVQRLQAALDEARVDGGAGKFESLEPHAAIERVIAMRAEARRAKDWAESDRLRDVLQQCGVELHDTKEGTSWTTS